MPTIILEQSLRYQNHKILDFASQATDGRFRLVDCRAFLDRDRPRLQVEEFSFDDMPNLRYAAISYPWKGITARPTLPTFNVEGVKEDGDPISVDVIHDACIAACHGGANYIWLDRLCVIQHKARSGDKHAQIERMHEVYLRCALCIVIPGGLQRLVRLDEETPWILRSWTLQESLSPPNVVVLFAWRLGSGRGGSVKEVTPGRSATISLQGLVNDSSEGFMEFVRDEGRGTVDEDAPTCIITMNIFHRRSSHARALAAAMARKYSQDFTDNAVWQSAQLRTSSRPVDMVFSIMGMFGVTLDTKKYGREDRLRATIDLAKEILKQGRSASWLGASFRLPPCKYISTFSLFPKTHVRGGAFIQTPSGHQDISNFVGGDNLSVETLTTAECLKPSGADDTITAAVECIPALGKRLWKHDSDELFGSDVKLLPRGSMDDAGYLEIEALSLPVQRCSSESDAEYFCGVDGKGWEACRLMDQDNHEIVYFAIFVGMYKKYHYGGRYEGIPFPGDGNFAKLMIVARHDAQLQRFHAVTFCVRRNIVALSKLEWASRKFRIGGPEPLQQGEMEEQVVDYEPELASDMHPDVYELAELSERVKARPQEEVEEFFRMNPTADRFPHDSFVRSIWCNGKNKLEQAVIETLDELISSDSEDGSNDDDSEDGSNDDSDAGSNDDSDDGSNDDDLEDGSNGDNSEDEGCTNQ